MSFYHNFLKSKNFEKITVLFTDETYCSTDFSNQRWAPTYAKTIEGKKYADHKGFPGKFCVFSAISSAYSVSKFVPVL